VTTARVAVVATRSGDRASMPALDEGNGEDPVRLRAPRQSTVKGKTPS
jgi:hypothetical protein